MKQVFAFLATVLLTVTLWAQSPEKMSYQAIIRNSSDQLVTSHAVRMKISILQGSANGTAVYAETHSESTNANGLVTVEIGGGTVFTGTFSKINWSDGPFFIKTETDPAGGTNYTITGTSQLLSVPYALYSKSSADGFAQVYSETDKRPVLYNNGNIGIGTANNWAKLDVNGKMHIGPGSDTWGTQISIDASTIENGKFYRLTSTGGDAGEGQGKLVIGCNGKGNVMVMDSNLNVGIGTDNPKSLLSVGADGNSNSTIHASNNADNGRAFSGTSYGNEGIGLYGTNNGTKGMGVYGHALNLNNSTNYGGYFVANGTTGRGIYGMAANSSGTYNYGGYFEALGTESYGVYAIGNARGGCFKASGTGHTGYGVIGIVEDGTESRNFGGYFISMGLTSIGAYGESGGTNGWGIYGCASNTADARNCGGYFSSAGKSGVGVDGEAHGTNGIGGYFRSEGSNGIGVYAEGKNSAAIFEGDVNISGDLNVNTAVNTILLNALIKNFRIDHPLYPDSMYLSHSSIESSEILNLYSGNITLNDTGEAWINLPDWFEALNKDFTYQLSCIGCYAQVYIAKEIENNKFKIAGGSPGMKVSWQVTGKRHDKFVEEHPLQVEQLKNLK